MNGNNLISVLIIEGHVKTAEALSAILRDNNTVFIHVESAEEALSVIDNIEIGIVLLNIDTPYFNETNFLDHLRQNKDTEDIYTIVYSDSLTSATNFVKGLNEGAVDYFTKPFNPNLIKAKINVYKSFYLKDRKIEQLLSNILPQKVIESYEEKGYYEPKKVKNGVVMFTDFVSFSNHSSHLRALPLLRKLDVYFTKFDEIIERFRLEKIKTIGDAYMALAGVNRDLPHPIVRACLAALEIRNWIINKNEAAKALDLSFWDIRIGIHAGPLVSGVIGQKKITFDVWGDTVNIANRTEQNSHPNEVNVTKPIAEAIEQYFDLEQRGEMEIPKRGGTFEMFFIRQIKPSFSIMGEGKLPNAELRKILGLPTMDFDYARKEILEILKAHLSDRLTYHTIHHIVEVDEAAVLLAKMEGVKGIELILLRTAVLLHDAGYAFTNEDNAQYAFDIAQKVLPKYGYSNEETEEVINMIKATKFRSEPQNLIEQIICDANLVYLGKSNYYEIAADLREEFVYRGKSFTDEEWLTEQIQFLEHTHRYYTNTAKNTLEYEKQKRLKELKLMLG